jgi:hypothetical protein
LIPQNLNFVVGIHITDHNTMPQDKPNTGGKKKPAEPAKDDAVIDPKAQPTKGGKKVEPVKTEVKPKTNKAQRR